MQRINLRIKYSKRPQTPLALHTHTHLIPIEISVGISVHMRMSMRHELEWIPQLNETNKLNEQASLANGTIEKIKKNLSIESVMAIISRMEYNLHCVFDMTTHDSGLHVFDIFFNGMKYLDRQNGKQTK